MFAETKSDTSRKSSAMYAVTKSDTRKNPHAVYADTESNHKKHKKKKSWDVILRSQWSRTPGRRLIHLYTNREMPGLHATDRHGKAAS